MSDNRRVYAVAYNQPPPVLFPISFVQCIICAVTSVLWERDNSAWYVPDLSLVTGSAENRFVGVSEMTVRDAFVNGFFIFLTMIILLQILIPISLYVTIEIIKLCQVKI